MNKKYQVFERQRIIPLMLAGFFLCAGAFSYLLWRPQTLAEQWLEFLLPFSLINSLSEIRQALHLEVPLWLSGSFADVCWAVALTAAIWWGELRSYLLPLVVVCSMELAQLAGVIPGTFDSYDLVGMSLAVLLTYAFLKTLSGGKDEQQCV